MSGTGIQIVGDTGWILPTLATDTTVAATWTHYGYRRRNGIVYLVLNLTLASPAADKLLFTLPVGFRPVVQDTKVLLLAGFPTTGSIRVSPIDGTVRSNGAVGALIVVASYPVGA